MVEAAVLGIMEEAGVAGCHLQVVVEEDLLHQPRIHGHIVMGPNVITGPRNHQLEMLRVILTAQRLVALMLCFALEMV